MNSAEMMAKASAARRRLGLGRPHYNTVVYALRQATAALLLKSISPRHSKTLERRAMKVIDHLNRYEDAIKKC